MNNATNLNALEYLNASGLKFQANSKTANEDGYASGTVLVYGDHLPVKIVARLVRLIAESPVAILEAAISPGTENLHDLKNPLNGYTMRSILNHVSARATTRLYSGYYGVEEIYPMEAEAREWELFLTDFESPKTAPTRAKTVLSVTGTRPRLASWQEFRSSSYEALMGCMKRTGYYKAIDDRYRGIEQERYNELASIDYEMKNALNTGQIHRYLDFLRQGELKMSQ